MKIDIKITRRLLEKYPDVDFFGLVVRNLPNKASDNALEPEKKNIVDFVMKNAKEPKKLDLVKSQNKFFNAFGKSVPIEYQLGSIFKGKGIPSQDILKDILFMAEMKTFAMISGHDLDVCSGKFMYDLSTGGETYTKINGKGQTIKADDILLYDKDRIITSLLYGPGEKDRITKDTKDMIFLFWFFEKVSEDKKQSLIDEVIDLIDIVKSSKTTIERVDAAVQQADGKKDFIVTPWEVGGNIDYDKLIKNFGVKSLDSRLRKRIKKITKDDNYMIRRNIFFSHMYLDKLLDEYEKGIKFYLYTGRAPSGPIHLGHLVPWLFTKWLQDRFDVTLLFQIPDEEKFLFKHNLTLKDTKDWAYENILDIIALGFDPKKTKIFLDTEYAGHMYPLACRVAKKLTLSTIKSTFGFTDSHNIGITFYTAMQSVPALLPTEMEGKKTRVLIPCAIDQDVHFRLTRDVAESLGYPKPATILCRFLPGLGGIMEDGKMSSSAEHTTIWTTDTAKQVRKKIMKYAFSGGKDTVEEHRKLGGNPDIDVSYQWLTFFEPDDAKLEKIYNDYKSGKLLSGELKQILVDTLNSFLSEHQKRREKAKGQIEKFMLRD